MDEVVISSSRIPESVREAPAAVRKVTPLELRLSPQLNVYEAPTPYSGLIILTPSIGFKVINSRGFNKGNNERVVYIADGMDLQSPGINIPVGILNGVGDAEVLNAEFIQGPSSALYGANAFNGVYVINVRDPYEYPGLVVNLKSGVNHLDGKDTNPSPFYDLSFMYSKPFLKNKAAFSFSFASMQIEDWYATDTTDIANYENSIYKQRGTSNPGYDGVNIYGDEVSIIAWPEIFNQGGFTLVKDPYRVSRTGYLEKNLLDYGIKTYRGTVRLSYKLNPKLRINTLGRVSKGSGIMQGSSRFQLRDFISYQTKLELQGENFIVRAYMNGEDAGKTYDSRFAAFYINRETKPDENWIYQYVFAFSGAKELGIVNFLNSQLIAQGRDTIVPYNAYSARKFANANNSFLYNTFYPVAPQMASLLLGNARYEAGSDSFNILLNQAINTTIDKGGASFIEKTRFYHFDAQYRFENIENWDILVGGSFRYFQPNSQGTYFIDSNNVDINYYETGIFGLAKKYLWDKKLLITSSLRIDKPQNFDVQINPRIATLLFLGENKQHVIRAGFQTGYRIPTLEQQFGNVRVNSALTLVGGLGRTLKGVGLLNNTIYTASSVTDFRREIINTGGDTLAAAKKLKPLQLNPIKPEHINTLETGFRGTFLNGKLYVDVTIYYNQYSHLVRVLDVVGPRKQEVGTDEEPLSYSDLLPDSNGIIKSSEYLVWTNIENDYHSFGILPFIEYKFNKHVRMRVSYSYEELLENEDLLKSDVTQAFNTPLHRTSESLIIEKIKKRWNFQITHKWVDAFPFKSSFINSYNIPAYNTVDLQVSYLIPKQHIMLKLGGQNILNNRHIEIAGGPTIGALVYFQINFDPLIN